MGLSGWEGLATKRVRYEESLKVSKLCQSDNCMIFGLKQSAGYEIIYKAFNVCNREIKSRKS